MNFDVYCDESRPDLFSTKCPRAKLLVIGSVWLPSDRREEYKAAIHELRDEYWIGGEFKWQRISPSRQEFYCRLVQWFLDQGHHLRFRCIAVDHKQANLLKFHENDQELAFYKFYYQLLHHWILDFNEYAIFCDFKSNREGDRLEVLRRCLDYSNLSSQIRRVQAVRSSESVLLQLADVLTGAASARLNDKVTAGGAKEAVVATLETGLERRIQRTVHAEQKFNVFQINLRGGW